MDTWNQLYDQFRQIEVERQERARRQRQEAAERRAFEAWSAKAAERFMHALSDKAKQRAQDVWRNTGRLILVEYPSHRPIRLGPKGPFMSFMRLSLDGSHVDVYTHRIAGAVPFVHTVRTPNAGVVGRKHPRMVSVPVCVIARQADDSFELLRAPTPGASLADDKISMDEVLYGAFQQLAEGLRRTGAN